MANLADLTISVGAKIGDIGSALGKIPGMADDAVDGVVRKFDGLGDKLKPVMAAAGAAAGAALVVGAVEGIEREALSDKLAAQMNLGEADSAAAGAVAGKLYADAYGENLGQVNQAIRGVAGSLDVDIGNSDALERLSAKALDVTSAFDVDLNQAIGNAGILMRTGLADDADHAFDLITASLQDVAPELVDELGEATKEYSKFFAALGVSGEDALGLLASADDQFSLDKTGDAIKELTIRGADMSELSVSAYEAMGLSAEEMSAKILAGGDTARGGFDEIVDGLLGIEDPTAQANAAVALFGTPLEDLGTAQIPDFLSSLDDMGGGLGDVAGRADDMGDTLNDNASTKITGFKRSVEEMLAKVVEAPGLLGAVATGAAGLGQVLEPIGPAVAGVGFVFKDQLSSVVGHLGKGAKSAAKWSAKTVASAGKATASFVAHTAATVASKGAALAVAAAQKVWAAAQWALNAAMSANPIGLIVAAIAALAAAAVWAYQNVDWFRAGVDAAWDAIQAVISWAWDTVIKPVFDAMVSAIQSYVIPYYELLWSVAQKVWDGITAAVSAAWNSVIKPIWDAIAGFITGILIPYYQKMWDVAQTVWAGIQAAVSVAWSVLSSIFGQIRDWITTYVVGAFNLAKSVASSAWSGVQSAVSGAWGFISGTFTSIRDGVQGVIDKFWEIAGAIGSALGGVADTIKSPFVSAFGAIKRLWNNTVGGFSVEVPSWVPGMGGKGFSIPNMHTGGIVPGSPGQEVLRILEAGELVIPADMASRLSVPRVGRVERPDVMSVSSQDRGGVVVQVASTDADPYEIGREIMFNQLVAG